MTESKLLRELITIEESKNLTIKDFEKKIFESAFTDAFLNKVIYAYRLNSHREALSVIWSNDLKKVIKFMAEVYYKKYKEARKHNKSSREYKSLREKEDPTWKEKYNKNIEELTKKAYHNKVGENKIIERTEKKLEYLDLETLEYSSKEINKLKSDLNKYKGRIHKILLIIRR